MEKKVLLNPFLKAQLEAKLANEPYKNGDYFGQVTAGVIGIEEEDEEIENFHKYSFSLSD